MLGKLITTPLVWLAFLIGTPAVGAEVVQPPPHVARVEAKPAAPSPQIARLLGDYGEEQSGVHVFERGGRLMVRMGKDDGEVALQRMAADVWHDSAHKHFSFKGTSSTRADAVELDGKTLPRRDYGAEADARARELVKVDDKLIAGARKATPPTEQGKFRRPDLVALATLDSTIKLDIRYASTNNFASYPVYRRAGAFMQRPAAEAVVRAHRYLKKYGYGLAIHDGYRPWYITKVFWDATPAAGKDFVADPAQGSRHNRGCAIDLTLYDLATGKIVEMPGRYDEMSVRSYPGYFGGTSLQRWQRELLRYAMEQQGFEVYPFEWWHFDFKDWKEYPILNVEFDEIDSKSRPAA